MQMLVTFLLIHNGLVNKLHHLVDIILIKRLRLGH